MKLYGKLFEGVNNSIDNNCRQRCQILKHSNQWVETIDPSIVAMKVLLQTLTAGTSSLFETLTTKLTKLAKMYHDSMSNNGSGKTDMSGNFNQHHQGVSS
jgi:hypothetical protein